MTPRLLSAALALVATTCASPAPAQVTQPPGRIACLAARAVDGDTLRCANLPAAVRLLGIDAPEMPGHCRTGRRCVEGDPVASRSALAQIIASGTVTLEVIGRDRYGRNLALVWVRAQLANPVTGTSRTVNLACSQISSGHAVYVPAWDNGRRVARECGQGGGQ